MSCQLAFRVTKGVMETVRTPIFNIMGKEAEEVEEPEDGECATKRCFLDIALSLNLRNHCNSGYLHGICTKRSPPALCHKGKRLEKD